MIKLEITVHVGQRLIISFVRDVTHIPGRCSVFYAEWGDLYILIKDHGTPDGGGGGSLVKFTLAIITAGRQGQSKYRGYISPLSQPLDMVEEVVQGSSKVLTC